MISKRPMALMALAGICLTLFVAERLWAAFAVPDAATAFRVSLEKIRSEPLSEVAARWPERCQVFGTAGLGWEAQCLRTFQDIPPTECTVVSWNIDRWGTPSSTFAIRGRRRRCLPAATFRSSDVRDGSEAEVRPLSETDIGRAVVAAVPWAYL